MALQVTLYEDARAEHRQCEVTEMRVLRAKFPCKSVIGLHREVTRTRANVVQVIQARQSLARKTDPGSIIEVEVGGQAAYNASTSFVEWQAERCVVTRPGSSAFQAGEWGQAPSHEGFAVHPRRLGICYSFLRPQPSGIAS